MKKKNIYILICIIIFVIIAAFVAIKFFNKDNLKEEQIINYFLLYKKTGVGVVDRNGNNIIECKYLDIVIPDYEYDVFLCYEDNYSFKVLNKEGKEILNNISNIEPIQATAFEDMPYRKLLKYKENNKYGLINVKGEKITKPIYDEISVFHNDPTSYKIIESGKVGLLDLEGKVKLRPDYTEIVITMSQLGNDEHKDKSKIGYILKNINDKGQKFGFASEHGEILIKPEFETITMSNAFSNDYLLVTQLAGRKGFYKNKNKILKAEFQEIIPSSQYVVAKKYNKYGLFSLDGREILKEQFDSFKTYGKYVLFTKDNKNYLYDFNGNNIDSGGLIILSDIPNKNYIIVQDRENKVRIISGNNLLKIKCDEIEYAFDRYFITKTNNKYGIFDVKTEKMVLKEENEYIKKYEDTNILMVYNGKSYDIYDANIVKINFDSNFGIKKFSDDLVQIFSKDNMKYLNGNGEDINIKDRIKHKYYAIQDANTKLWGYSDANGNIALKPKYQLTSDFNEYGFATIKQDGLYGVIDENLNIIEEPKYNFGDKNILPSFLRNYLIDENSKATLIAIE